MRDNTLIGLGSKEPLFIDQIRLLYCLLNFFWQKQTKLVIVCIFAIFLQIIKWVFRKSLRLILILRSWQAGYFTNWKFVGWFKSGYLEEKKRTEEKNENERAALIKGLIGEARKNRQWAFLPKEPNKTRIEAVEKLKWRAKLNKLFSFDLLIIIDPELHYGILREASILGVPCVIIQSSFDKNYNYKNLNYKFLLSKLTVQNIMLFLFILLMLVHRIQKIKKISIWPQYKLIIWI
jgi:hypothetical protein